jgi:hypothetical protein
MRSLHTLIAAAVLLAAPAAYAQDTQRVDGPEAAAQPAPRVAVPRSEAPRADTPGVQVPRAAAPVTPATPSSAAVADDQRRGGRDAGRDGRQAVPRGSRPRGDNPQTGIAVPRDARRQPVPDRRGDRDRGRVYSSRPPVFNNYYYYPRRSYPYGYGAFGLGYFYYDPYTWYGPGYYGVAPYYRGGAYYGGGSYYDGPRYGYPVGQLRLRVEPRDAQVFVDGYFAGVVDDYDGIVQSLSLEEGAHHIEIVAPGLPPLEFDVRILPGQKITYRGDLRAPRP